MDKDLPAPWATPDPPMGKDQLPRNSIKHEDFEPVGVHTAKCDKCDRRNDSVLQRCIKCNMQFCYKCMNKNGGDGIHFVAMDDPTWIPEPNMGRRPYGQGSKKGVHASPEAALTGLESALNGGRVNRALEKKKRKVIEEAETVEHTSRKRPRPNRHRAAKKLPKDYEIDDFQERTSQNETTNDFDVEDDENSLMIPLMLRGGYYQDKSQSVPERKSFLPPSSQQPPRRNMLSLLESSGLGEQIELATGALREGTRKQPGTIMKLKNVLFNELSSAERPSKKESHQRERKQKHMYE